MTSALLHFFKYVNNGGARKILIHAKNYFCKDTQILITRGVSEGGREEVPCREGKNEGLRVRRRHASHPRPPAWDSLAEQTIRDLELVINCSEISEPWPRHQKTFNHIHITHTHTSPHIHVLTGHM